MGLDLHDPKHASYVGWMLSAASVRLPGRESQTAIPCLRRPGRRPCIGHMCVMLTEVPERLSWRCSECGDRGSMQGWRRNVWNLRGFLLERVSVGRVDVTVTPQEYRLLRESICGPTVMVANARLAHDGNVRLSGDQSDAEDLLLALSEVPREHREGERGQRLDRVRRRVERARSSDGRLAELPNAADRGALRIDAREVLVSFARGYPPDERMRQLMRELACALPVPFKARLGRQVVQVEAVTYCDGDPPELRGETVFEGQRVQVNLGAFQIDSHRHPVYAAVVLYRTWWNEQRTGQTRGG